MKIKLMLFGILFNTVMKRTPGAVPQKKNAPHQFSSGWEDFSLKKQLAWKVQEEHLTTHC